MALVINSQEIEVDGLVSRNWHDDPDLRLRIGLEDGNDGYYRGPDHWLHLIGIHTTKGYPDAQHRAPQTILPGAGDPGAADLVARSWSNDRTTAGGAQAILDRDGVVACCADLVLEAAYHIVGLSYCSYGVEVFQGSDSSLYQAQLDAWLKLADYTTRRLGIQRQVVGTSPYRNRACKRLLPKSKGGTEGADVVGIVGHRAASDNRGEGDPGDALLDVLTDAGYEFFDCDSEEDKHTWQQRQHDLGMSVCDGVPGPATVRALIAAGKPGGMWVPRPGDDR